VVSILVIFILMGNFGLSILLLIVVLLNLVLLSGILLW
jgi:hypothetical protein